MEYLTERRNCKGKESPLIFQRAEKCVRIHGSYKRKALSFALPGKLCRLSWVLLFIAPGFPNPPIVPSNTEIALHFLDKNFKVWGCSFVIRIGFTAWQKAPARETPADEELLALCPPFSTVWRVLQRPQRTTPRLCCPGLPAEVVTASVSHPWRAHLWVLSAQC